MKPSELALALVVGLGLLGGLGWGIKAFIDRKVIAATAASNQASATAVITAAARELVDPLRRELAAERDEQAQRVEAERRKLAEMRAELEAAIEESQTLRSGLHEMRDEMQELQRENQAYRRRNAELERELAEARKNLPPT